jgi:hypothetical protein
MRKPLFDQNVIMGLFSDFRAAQINERKCAKTGAQEWIFYIWPNLTFLSGWGIMPDSSFVLLYLCHYKI